MIKKIKIIMKYALNIRIQIYFSFKSKKELNKRQLVKYIRLNCVIKLKALR